VRGRAPHAPTGALIVDDGSRPPLDAAAVRHDVSRGPAAARGAGLALVTTPFVAFVDADVRVPPGWLAGLLPHFADERVALVAPRVRSAPSAGRLARYEADRSPLDLGPEPARVRAGTRVSYVPAAAVVCRVDALRALGGFDPALRYGEDVDLVWRLDEAGWRVRYEPAVEVLHAPRQTWGAWWRQRHSYGSSAAALARRHPGALSPVRMNGWSAAAWVAAVAGHPVVGALIGAGSSAALVPKLPAVPPRVALRLAGTGTLRAGQPLADAVRRAWWPLLVVAAIRSRTARRALVAAAVAAGRPLRLVDDVAYSTGVWSGMWRERTLAPIVPRFSAWPGRRRAPSGRPAGR
jgi:mycofactocin system glycosyltransferase